MELLLLLLHRTRVSLLTRPHKITHSDPLVSYIHLKNACIIIWKIMIIKKNLKELLTGDQNWFVTRSWTHQSSSGRSIAAQMELMGAVKEPRRAQSEREKKRQRRGRHTTSRQKCSARDPATKRSKISVFFFFFFFFFWWWIFVI